MNKTVTMSIEEYNELKRYKDNYTKSIEELNSKYQEAKERAKQKYVEKGEEMVNEINKCLEDKTHSLVLLMPVKDKLSLTGSLQQYAYKVVTIGEEKKEAKWLSEVPKMINYG